MTVVFFLVAGIVVGTLLDGTTISYICPKIMGPQDGWQEIAPLEAYQYAAMACFIGALVGFAVGIFGMFTGIIFYFWLFTQNLKIDTNPALKALGLLLVSATLNIIILKSIAGFFASV
jgi:hypothetical protein